VDTDRSWSHFIFILGIAVYFALSDRYSTTIEKV
jgi:hypothetical protein